jgi:hypothetical protein
MMQDDCMTETAAQTRPIADEAASDPTTLDLARYPEPEVHLYPGWVRVAIPLGAAALAWWGLAELVL